MEKMNNEPEPLEKQQQKLDGYNELSKEAKDAFKYMASDLGFKKDGEKYSADDIDVAAKSRVDNMLQSSGVQMSKLNDTEKERLESLKKEMFKGMEGKDVQGKLEAYNEARIKIQGLIAAGDGKSQKTNNDIKDAQQRGQEVQKDTQDAFDKLKDFLKDVSERQQQEQKTQKQALEKAQQGGNTEQVRAQSEAYQVFKGPPFYD